MRARKLAAVLTLGGVLAIGSVAPPAAAAVQDQLEAPLIAAKARRLGGDYIVVLKQDQEAHSVARRAGVGTRHVYDRALRGFSATLNQQQLMALRRDAAVEFIEEDAEITLDATQTVTQT